MIDPSTWIAAIFTILVFTFLYKENPLYRFAEHTVVGASAGYAVALAIKNINDLSITPMIKGTYMLVLPLTLGILIFTRYIKAYRWLSRYPVAIMTGIAIGLSVRTYVHAQFTEQIVATMLPIVGVPLHTAINNLLIIIIVICVPLYFIFTREPKGMISRLTKIGRIAMMVAFGTTFGTTVTTRMVYLIGRLQFLLFEWLKLGV
jgi:hypothetical protein